MAKGTIARVTTPLIIEKPFSVVISGYDASTYDYELLGVAYYQMVSFGDFGYPYYTNAKLVELPSDLICNIYSSEIDEVQFSFTLVTKTKDGTFVGEDYYIGFSNVSSHGTSRVNDNDYWKYAKPWVNVGGTNKPCVTWSNVDGLWRRGI